MQRRLFLKRTIELALGTRAAILLSGSLPATALAQLNISALTEHQARSLTILTQCLFPHPNLDSTYYIEIVNQLDMLAKNDPTVLQQLQTGITTLDKTSKGLWVELTVDDKITVLESLEQSDFMQFMIMQTLERLYGNQEVISQFGYQGSSLEHGGYLHRGFDDIDWLPDTK